MKKLIIFCLALCGVSVLAQYEDKRCSCICPSIGAVFNNSKSKERHFFRDSLPASKCNCYGLIVPKMRLELKGRESQFCHRCECKFEWRNTTVIMIVVFGVLWIMSALSVYMGFLYCLDPFKHKRHQSNADRLNEEAQNLLLSEGGFED